MARRSGQNQQVGRGSTPVHAVAVAGVVAVVASLWMPSLAASQEAPADTPDAETAGADDPDTDADRLRMLALAEELRAAQREQAVKALEQAREDLGVAQAAVAAATARSQQAEHDLATAEEALVTARSTLGSAAVDAYMMIGASGSPSGTDRSNSLLQSDRIQELSTAAVDALHGRLDEAVSDRNLARSEFDSVKDQSTELTAEVAEAELAIAPAEAHLRRVTAIGDVTVALSQFGGIDGPVKGITLAGPSAVSAPDLAEFVRARGVPHESIDLENLASLFLQEGAAEGIRGDIAFVQSILETGWFSFRNSMVEVTDNNYAGIGACDSCANGYWYPGPREGVRAQIQLLRTYAEAELTTADLANAPVRSAPERISVRGCCETWSDLTGVWATADGYGARILEIYAELLRFALQD